MNIPSEKDFENSICSYLEKRHGYLRRENSDYDKASCIDISLFASFIKETQESALKRLEAKRSGIDELAKHLEAELKAKSLIELLDNGISYKMIDFDLIYKVPKSSKNETMVKKYEGNTLSYIRQLKFSQNSEESIDIVLFINGIAFLTIELKNEYSGQNVFDAISQFKARDFKEAIFRAGRVALHLAIDNELCYMATKLEGEDSVFLPFNKGQNDGYGFSNDAIDKGVESDSAFSGAGNPINKKGTKTAYIWEEILERKSIIKLLTIFVQKEEGSKGARYIFPRYHQISVVDRILEDIKRRDEAGRALGGCYLVQHSAGSGKSKSIAWLAKSLLDLHSSLGDAPIFSTVVILTDRKVLDGQTKNSVSAAIKIEGVVRHVESANELKKALENGIKVIVSTIQKFPHIEGLDLSNKGFAVIIDEAHSSQGGEYSSSLNATISHEDTGVLDATSLLEEMAKNRHLASNASYFAFTATPNAKTLGTFGATIEEIKGKEFRGLGERLPAEFDRAALTAGERKYPFHLYSMKQAIEEGYILDVLKNYTTFKTVVTLAKKSEEKLAKARLKEEFSDKKAKQKIAKLIATNDAIIKDKAAVIAEHYISKVWHAKIEGRARAMVVTSSIEAAIKYYFAINDALESIVGEIDSTASAKCEVPKAIIAFSGECKIDGVLYTQYGINGFSDAKLTEEFKKEPNRILVVADMYQTGFDEPLLHSMYVDKRLSGIAAVQTLSRLNRTMQGKDDTFILDFVNDAVEIAASFAPYYESTSRTGANSEEELYQIEGELASYKVYDKEECRGVVDIILGVGQDGLVSDVLSEGALQARLNSALDPIVARYNDLKDSLEDATAFYNKAKSFVDGYGYLSQILPFVDIDLQTCFMFLKVLLTKIYPPREEDDTAGLLKAIDIKSLRCEFVATQDISLSSDGTLEALPLGGIGGEAVSKSTTLEALIVWANERYGEGILDEASEAELDEIGEKIRVHEEFKNILNTDEEKGRREFSKLLEDLLMEREEENKGLVEKYYNDEEFNREFRDRMYDVVVSGAIG